jgi:Tat protein translocase TatC
MAEQFSMHIMVSLIAGVVVAFPYIFWEFWRFIVPALYEKEKRTASGAVFYTSLLFILGVMFGYYIIAPLSVNFLGNYKVSESVISAPTLRSYVGTITSVVLASGIVFQLPILVYFLSKVGLVTPDFLKRYRRHSLVLIVTLSAIITPPDVFSQVLVALPLMVLYEIGIVISRRIVREQDKEMSGDEPPKKKKKPPKDLEPEAKNAETPGETKDTSQTKKSSESEEPTGPQESSESEEPTGPEKTSEPKETKTTKKKNEKPPWKKPGESEETSPTDQSD